MCPSFHQKKRKPTRVNARICPRLLPRPIGNSDVAYPQMMYKEPFTVQPPEALCARMKEFFSH